MRRALARGGIVLFTWALAAAPSGAQAPAGPPEAERVARERWYDFELAPLVTRAGGDWVRVVADKQAEEEKLAKAWKAHSSPRMKGAPQTAAQARAERVLQLEFTQVAQARQAEIRALARRVLLALQKGDVDALAGDAVMYDATAPDRLELTRKALREQRGELQKAAKLADTSAPDFATDLLFHAPSPATGMVGQVSIPFGPKARAPKTPKTGGTFPARHEIELWWSGQVMPEANGPVHPAPSAGRKLVSRWRFYAVVMPYSRRPMMLQ
jgi:hypothetical protein